MKQYKIENGYFAGVVESDYLLSNCTRTPVNDESKSYSWVGNRWVEVDPSKVKMTQPISKKEQLKSLTVTTINGNTFDADDIARADMLCAIEASSTLCLTDHNWKLADNSWVLITVDELKEACALAIQAKCEVLMSL